jgi:predicted kinase
MSILVLLVGLPASGKSYYAEKRIAQSGDSYRLHSSDAILEEIAKDAGMTYDEVFKDNIKIANKLFWQELQASIDSNENIIVDRTSLTVKSRKRIIDMAKAKDYFISAEVFETHFYDNAKWKEFLASREGKTIPSHVIGSMMFSYERPTHDEGIDTYWFHETYEDFA